MKNNLDKSPQGKHGAILGLGHSSLKIYRYIPDIFLPENIQNYLLDVVRFNKSV